jgi:hypothetical protein
MQFIAVGHRSLMFVHIAEIPAVLEHILFYRIARGFPECLRITTQSSSSLTAGAV